MGGKGSGGHRVGSGRKPKDSAVGALHGSRRTRARANQTPNQTPNQNQAPTEHTAAVAGEAPRAVAVASRIAPPGNLTLEQFAVWNEVAPLAESEGTLTQATALALRDLCEAIVLKRKLLAQAEDDGLVLSGDSGLRAHPLLPSFRGLMQRVEAGLTRFKLAPMGKELPLQGDKPADPFDEFDAAPAPANAPTTH